MAPETTVVASACPLDCPDNCSLDVTVAGDRVVRIEGATARNPLTEGYVCAKVRRFGEHVHGEERIRFPQRRVGRKGEGHFERLSWDAALELATRRLLEVRDGFGGEAILPYSYGGSNGALSQGTADDLLFHRLGASRLARTVCAAPTGAVAGAMTGKMPGVALADFVHSRLIVVWGANPHATGIHLVPQIERARAAGATLVVVDPRRTSLARHADLHLAVRPGSDVAVALAIVRELFARGAADLAFLREHTTGWEDLQRRAEPWTIDRAAATAGIEPGQLGRFAELYAELSPAVVRCGWGVERNRNGGSAVAAILALPAVGGKFGVRGGGFTMSNSGAWTLDGAAIGGPEPPTRIVNMNRLGRALAPDAEPPVKLLFVYDSNALATTPNQNLVRAGLEREDLFTIVFDAVHTDTARYADLLLPATTFLEHAEVSRGYGAYALHVAAPAIPPVGESRSNYAVFAELARRTGAAGEGEIPDESSAIAALVESTGRGSAVRRELATRGYAAPECGENPVQFVDALPRTPDGRMHLVPELLDREAVDGLFACRPDPATRQFPLALISPATRRTISSSLGQLRRDRVPLEIHPDDAAARNLQSGERVRVWNDYGEVLVTLRITDATRPGVVVLPKGLWSHNTLNGATANALVPDDLTDIAGGACFNDARVEVERL